MASLDMEHLSCSITVLLHCKCQCFIDLSSSNITSDCSACRRHIRITDVANEPAIQKRHTKSCPNAPLRRPSFPSRGEHCAPMFSGSHRTAALKRLCASVLFPSLSNSFAFVDCRREGELRHVRILFTGCMISRHTLERRRLKPFRNSLTPL